MAFPLLKKLTQVGDPKAKKILKEEIIRRYESGHPQTMQYLILEGYLKFLTFDEMLDLTLHPDLLNNFLLLSEELSIPLEDIVECVEIKEDSKYIHILDLSELELSVFPKVILKFKGLEELYLSFNQLSTIPESINHINACLLEYPKILNLRKFLLTPQEALYFCADTPCEFR